MFWHLLTPRIFSDSSCHILEGTTINIVLCDHMCSSHAGIHFTRCQRGYWAARDFRLVVGDRNARQRDIARIHGRERIVDHLTRVGKPVTIGIVKHRILDKIIVRNRSNTSRRLCGIALFAIRRTRLFGDFSTVRELRI